MEFLENLNKVLYDICFFSWIISMSLVVKMPPNIDIDLNKTTPKWRILQFQLNKRREQIRFLELLTTKKGIQVQEIRLVTYPGCIELSNDLYTKRKSITKLIMGWPIYIFPIKYIMPEETSQIIIINKKEIKRYGNDHYFQFTKSIIDNNLRSILNDFNSNNKNLSSSHSI